MIKKIDHIVITVKDIFLSMAFYEKLGFRVNNNGGKYELYVGDFKINVHILGEERLPHAQNIMTGSGDFCFEIEGTIESFMERLEQTGLQMEFGIVERQGVCGTMKSVYLRDPDRNLIEICSYE